MEVTRRDLLKAFAAVGAGVALAGPAGAVGIGEASVATKAKVMAAVKARASNTPVVWMQGQSCSGCSVSLLNATNPDIAELLTDTINLEFHHTVMGGTGDTALQMLDKAIAEQKGKFVLVAEGAIPTGANGEFCTVGLKNGKPYPEVERIRDLGNAAMAILAVGTCAAYGGIPGASGNVTGAKSVQEILPNATIINIPGCPAHPDWVAGTIAHVLLFGIPELDEFKRPLVFYGKTVHENCERRGYFDDGIFAEDYSGTGCLINLGCKGADSYCDAPIRSWNNRTNWCAESGGPCIGCTQPTFPDHTDGLYARLPDERVDELIRKSHLTA